MTPEPKGFSINPFNDIRIWLTAAAIYGVIVASVFAARRIVH